MPIVARLASRQNLQNASEVDLLGLPEHSSIQFTDRREGRRSRNFVARDSQRAQSKFAADRAKQN
jgi:hypothetical protein